MSKRIADLLYPHVSSDLTLLKQQYPDREWDQMVVRFGPSPTGMMHIWAVYTCMINTLFDPQTPRIFILRIEDTDQKRFVEWSIEKIVEWLKYFEIEFDEGPLTKTANGYESVGNYGPYIQTQRINSHHAVAKYLVESDYAYPCFLTEKEVDTIRKSQELQNKLPGIYGAYSTYRHTSDDDIIALIQQWAPYSIRLKNGYAVWDKYSYHDLIKWDLTMWVAHQDAVLIKSDWIAVYHLASMVDDWLMWVTHVIRSDEWIPSVPLHAYIISLFNPKPPQFAHPGPLLKLDAGNRRKLSKRKDPEADADELLRSWYEPEAIANYLANIINSGYEDWWLEDSSRHYRDYPFSMDRVNSAGAIVDMVKADAVSQDTFARFSDQTIYDNTINWAKHYHSEYIGLLENNKDVCLQAIGIERHDGHDPKRFVTYQDVVNHCRLFIDSEFDMIEYPQEWMSLTPDQVSSFINTYLPLIDLSQTKEAWFELLKSVGATLWYAATNGEFKAWWYVGKVGDLAMILRIALCKSPRTPDLYETMQVMGLERIKTRLQQLTK
jgi:glutamyl-tRNA synthetase